MLEAKNIYKKYNASEVLVDFSCTLQKGEILGLVGPNGAGKSTFLDILTGFTALDKGAIYLKNCNISSLKPYQRFRRGIARTFQEVRIAKQLSVIENVLLAFRNQPGESLRKVFLFRASCKHFERMNKDKAMELLSTINLGSLAFAYAGSLSYGQQKLLSLACCLASEAELILLDEPVSGLSQPMLELTVSIMKTLSKEGKSQIIIEHNTEVLKEIADRLIFLDAGRKICEGPPEQVFSVPSVLDAYLT